MITKQINNNSDTNISSGIREFSNLPGRLYSAGRLYSGHFPETNELLRLKKIPIDCLWNLTSEMRESVTQQREYISDVLCAEIKDYSVPSNIVMFTSQLNYIVSCLKQNKRVFVHCMGGRGRTGLALACIQVVLGINPEEALSQVKEHCNGPELEIQRSFVRNLTYVG